MKDKKIIYVCSKYRGDVKLNTHFAIGYCMGVYKMGHIPIAPHLYFTRFLDDNDPKEREDGLEMGLSLLRLCDELWVFGKDNISEGMQMEINFAKKNNIPIRNFY